MNAIILF